MLIVGYGALIAFIEVLRFFREHEETFAAHTIIFERTHIMATIVILDLSFALSEDPILNLVISIFALIFTFQDFIDGLEMLSICLTLITFIFCMGRDAH